MHSIFAHRDVEINGYSEESRSDASLASDGAPLGQAAQQQSSRQLDARCGEDTASLELHTISESCTLPRPKHGADPTCLSLVDSVAAQAVEPWTRL